MYCQQTEAKQDILGRVTEKCTRNVQPTAKKTRYTINLYLCILYRHTYKRIYTVYHNPGSKFCHQLWGTHVRFSYYTYMWCSSLQVLLVLKQQVSLWSSTGICLAISQYLNMLHRIHFSIKRFLTLHISYRTGDIFQPRSLDPMSTYLNYGKYTFLVTSW